MQTDFGCHPSRMYVSVGPMISALAYPVGKDVAEKFAVEHGEDVILRMPAGRVHLDLFVAILNDLWSAGIAREALPPRPPCTAANPQCASYRRDGPPVPSMLAWLRMVPENAKGSA
jgi:copper oxidase (laccase) domain-containing protein